MIVWLWVKCESCICWFVILPSKTVTQLKLIHFYLSMAIWRNVEIHSGISYKFRFPTTLIGKGQMIRTKIKMQLKLYRHFYLNSLEEGLIFHMGWNQQGSRFWQKCKTNCKEIWSQGQESLQLEQRGENAQILSHARRFDFSNPCVFLSRQLSC